MPTVIARKNVYESHGGHLETNLRGILGALPLYITTATTKEIPVNEECSTIVGREWQGVTKTIKEAMYIWVNDPSLNRNLAKYQLPHIWDEILQDPPTLWFK